MGEQVTPGPASTTQPCPQHLQHPPPNPTNPPTSPSPASSPQPGHISGSQYCPQPYLCPSSLAALGDSSAPRYRLVRDRP